MEIQFGESAGGMACLAAIARYYRLGVPELSAEASGKDENTLRGISKIAEKSGYRARIVGLTPGQFLRDAQFPCIVELDNAKLVVVLPYYWGKFVRKVKILEPGKGVYKMNVFEFIRRWAGEKTPGQMQRGMVLLLTPVPGRLRPDGQTNGKLSWKLIFQYFKRNRRQVWQLILTLVITSFLTISFPFLTQSLVDAGIENKDLNYIEIILSAQLMLIFSRTVVDFVRGHLLLYISTLVNISLMSDFWIKLTKLPISYFDKGRSGEILQRINDNKQLQNFLTGPTINIVFALLNFVVFAFVLATYQARLFFVFAAGVLLYFGWMMLFLKIRRKINFQLFHASAMENNVSLQLIQGMQEIKLLNVEQPKRWEWESVQSQIFRLNYRNLSIGQAQQAGAILINQGKDVFLTILVATAVVRGELTFGALLAIQYIIGQLGAPVEQFIRFVQDAQNAKISMDRLNEVHQLENEEVNKEVQSHSLAEKGGVTIDNLGFAYPENREKQVLKGIHLEIPEGKTTAIVGVSGSGKTTLLKLLLKFYSDYTGTIRIGDKDLSEINHTFWRRNCAVVFQDSYIFNDTIEKNIAVEFGEVDKARLLRACAIANILTFIESLPDGFATRLGVGGVGISQGQKQRLMIARAVYKDPKYVFFDESTNALDANTEKVILENLREFFEGRTVVVVAHRLSTVINADKIIVLEEGEIIEQGSHVQLSEYKGRYFELVRNQLEFGH